MGAFSGTGCFHKTISLHPYELYQAYTDYNGMMDITESMFQDCADRVNGKMTVNYGGMK